MLRRLFPQVVQIQRNGKWTWSPCHCRQRELRDLCPKEALGSSSPLSSQCVVGCLVLFVCFEWVGIHFSIGWILFRSEIAIIRFHFVAGLKLYFQTESIGFNVTINNCSI